MTNYGIETVEQLRAVIDSPNPAIEMKIFDYIDHHAREFIENSPLAYVATVDKDGNLDVSPKGNPAGFVAIESECSLLSPERKGNKLTYSFLNILATGKIGLIFIIPGVRETLRVNGSAQLSNDPDELKLLSADGKPALLCTRIAVQEVFFHCGKSTLRSNVWNRETWPVNFKPGVAKQISEKLNGGQAMETQLDAAFESDYLKGLY